MTSTIKPTTVRIDENLKAQANEILESMGLNYNSFVVMATHQLVNERRIPFEITAAPRTPNEDTRRALVAAEAKALGLIPDDAASFDDADKLMDYLDGE